MKPLLTLLVLLGITSSVMAYNATASPNCTLCILDQDGKPVAGLKIRRDWDGSDNQKGFEEATTDKDGKVSFEKVIIMRSVIKRIFKPLLAFVPASCGPESETTSFTSLTIYWPGDYDLKLPSNVYKHKIDKFFDYYYSKDGTRINGPEKGHTSIRVFFFNRKKDFDFTLGVYKGSAEQ